GRADEEGHAEEQTAVERPGLHQCAECRCGQRHRDEEEQQRGIHGRCDGRMLHQRSSPVSGSRYWSSSWPNTAVDSMKMVMSSVMTVAVRTKAWGSGSAATAGSVRPLIGSPRHADTPDASSMKFAAWEIIVIPNTARTIDRCRVRYTPPVTSTATDAARIMTGSPPSHGLGTWTSSAPPPAVSVCG